MERFSPKQKLEIEETNKRLGWLNDPVEFERRVLELCSEKEKEKIERLKNRLGWLKLPYRNLNDLIDYINYPKDITPEAIELTELIREKILDELSKIKEIYKRYRMDTPMLDFNISRLLGARGMPEIEKPEE